MGKTEGAGAFRPGPSSTQTPRHSIPRPSRRRAEGIILSPRHKPSPNRIFVDIPNSIPELLGCNNLRLVEAPLPHIKLSSQPEGKSALDELHCLLEGNVRRRCNQRMEMI